MNNNPHEKNNIGGNIQDAQLGRYSINVKNILLEAWELTLHSRFSIVVSSVFCLMLTLVTIMVASHYLGGVEKALADMRTQYIINILVTLIISPFVAGIEMMGVYNAVGIKAKTTLIFAFLSKSAIIAICALLSSTLSSLGLNLYVLPGIFLLVTLSLTVPLVVEKNMMPIQAIIISVKSLRFQFFKILAIYGVLMLGLLLAAFPLMALVKSNYSVVGVSFLLFMLTYLIPLFYHVKGILYREIFGLQVVSSDQSPINNDSSNFSA